MVRNSSAQTDNGMQARRIYLLAFSLLIILFGGWFWSCVHKSTQAETNLHSGRVVAEIIELYVETTCRWPQSWEDLEPYRRKKFQEGDTWAKERQQLMDRVDVQFSYGEALPTDDDFKNKPPVQPHIPYYRAPFEVRLDQLHVAVKRCRDK